MSSGKEMKFVTHFNKNIFKTKLILKSRSKFMYKELKCRANQTTSECKTNVFKRIQVRSTWLPNVTLERVWSKCDSSFITSHFHM